MYWLKIYLLSHGVCGSGGWVGMAYPHLLLQPFSEDCRKGVSQCWGLIWRLDWRGISFQAYVVSGRTQFLVGCWTESLAIIYQPEVILSSLPFESLHGVPHDRAASFIKASKEEPVSKVKITILGDIIVEVACSTLLVRSKSQSHPCSGREDLWRVWIPGTRHHRVCPAQLHSQETSLHVVTESTPSSCLTSS